MIMSETITELIDRANPAIDHWELEKLVALLHREFYSIKPVVVEIGVHRGGSAEVWASFQPRRLIGVDSANDLDRDVLGLKLVVGTSQSPQVYDQVVEALDIRKQVDFLFIDGGHTLEEVTSDFDAYSHLVRRGGGVVAFHDIRAIGTGVPVFWNEIVLSGAWPTIEICSPDSTGIGVVFL